MNNTVRLSSKKKERKEERMKRKENRKVILALFSFSLCLVAGPFLARLLSHGLPYRQNVLKCGLVGQ